MKDQIRDAVPKDQRSDGARAATLNARIDRLPVWGLSRAVFLVLGLSYVFVYYDITAFGVTLPSVLADFGLSESASAPPLTANLVAYIVGAYVLGTVADYIGRRVALISSLLLITVGGVLTALSWNITSLAVFRAITGLGMGAQIALAATLIGEYASAAKRARSVNIASAIGPVGLILPAFIGLALLPLPHVGWRIVFGIGGAAVLLLAFCGRGTLPESPRWLIAHGNLDRAEQIVQRMEHTAQTRSGAPLPPVPDVPADRSGSGFPTLQLFSRTYLPRLLMVFGYWTVFYLADYGFIGYQPTLLTKMGVSLPSGLVYAGLAYVGFLVGGLLTLSLADRVERKTVITIALLIAAVGFVLVAMVHTPTGAIIGGFLAGVGQYGASSAAYVYTAEIFPTRARASGMAFGDGLGHVGGALAPYLVLALLGALGPESTFISFAVLVIIALAILLPGARTKGRELTEVAR